jgi:tetratricopeptide (TPR) repeat protein
MSNIKKTPGKDNILIYVTLAFIAGFLSGAGFAVYKMGSPDTATTVAGQENISDQQNQAIAHLEGEVTTNPDKFQSWTQLANLYFDTGQYEKAVKAYEKSLTLHAGNADIWTDLGVMYRRVKQPEKAIEAFDKAVTMDPTHEISRLNKGIVLLYDLNDPQGAITSWENLLKINPNSVTGNGDSIREFVDQLKQDLEKAR